jgi:hypothetical protein
LWSRSRGLRGPPLDLAPYPRILAPGLQLSSFTALNPHTLYITLMIHSLSRQLVIPLHSTTHTRALASLLRSRCSKCLSPARCLTSLASLASLEMLVTRLTCSIRPIRPLVQHPRHLRPWPNKRTHRARPRYPQPTRSRLSRQPPTIG